MSQIGQAAFTRKTVLIGLELGNQLLGEAFTPKRATKLQQVRDLLQAARREILLFPKTNEQNLVYLPQLNAFLEQTGSVAAPLAQAA